MAEKQAPGIESIRIAVLEERERFLIGTIRRFLASSLLFLMEAFFFILATAALIFVLWLFVQSDEKVLQWALAFMDEPFAEVKYVDAKKILLSYRTTVPYLFFPAFLLYVPMLLFRFIRRSQHSMNSHMEFLKKVSDDLKSHQCQPADTRPESGGV